MAAHLTEEEQLEALKRWWQDNGKVVVTAILLAVIGWFGWSSWQDRQERQSQEASQKYTELMTAVSAAPGENLSEEDQATAKLIANEIIESQPKSLYGNLAALMMARLAVDSGDLVAASEQLRDVSGNAANSGIAQVANLRLARLLAAQGNYEEALTLINSSSDEAFQAAYAETRGDIHVAQNQLDLAQTAYEQALATLPPRQTNRSGILRLKLDNTRVAEGAGANPAAPVESAPAAEGDA